MQKQENMKDENQEENTEIGEWEPVTKSKFQELEVKLDELEERLDMIITRLDEVQPNQLSEEEWKDEALSSPPGSKERRDLYELIQAKKRAVAEYLAKPEAKAQEEDVEAVSDEQHPEAKIIITPKQGIEKQLNKPEENQGEPKKIKKPAEKPDEEVSEDAEQQDNEGDVELVSAEPTPNQLVSLGLFG